MHINKNHSSDNVPKLRFPGFEGEWEKKKFGEVVKINQGLQIAISERYTEKVDGSYFYITNEFLREGSEKKYFIKNPPKSVLCTKNDVLMTRTGNTGMVVTNVEGAFHNNFFKISYPNHLNKDYLVNFLVLPATQNHILKLAGTSTIPDLNHSDFYRIQIPFPTLPEQQKIASFFTAIDQKLTHLKRKKNLLEHYKKGVMQKIFAQEVRFKIENKDGEPVEPPDWERKRLGEIGKTYNGLTGKTKEDFGEGKPYVQYKQIFDDSRIDTTRFGLVGISPKENQNLVLFGDVFFTVSSETPNEIGTASVLLDEVEELYLNSFCFGYRANSSDILNPYFSRYLFRSQLFRNEIVKLAQGSTRYNMSKVQLLKIIVNLPSLPEQTKIANFLSAIDKKIEGVAEALEATEKWKKGLMQRMFC